MIFIILTIINFVTIIIYDFKYSNLRNKYNNLLYTVQKHQRFIENRCLEESWLSYQELVNMLKTSYRKSFEHLCNLYADKNIQDFSRKCIIKDWCLTHNITEEMFNKLEIDK